MSPSGKIFDSEERGRKAVFSVLETTASGGRKRPFSDFDREIQRIEGKKP